jgi:hypothetical protein
MGVFQVAEHQEALKASFYDFFGVHDLSGSKKRADMKRGLSKQAPSILESGE